MDFGIKQSVFLKAIQKGASAALSDEASSDIGFTATLSQSILIVVNENFSIHSSTHLMSVKRSLVAEESNGIKVDKHGSILVNAKDILQWVSAQNSSAVIRITLEKLEEPEQLADSDDGLKKIGTLKLSAEDKNKIISSWEIDGHDPDAFKETDFEKDTKHKFDIQCEELTDSFKRVSYVCEKDFDNQYNNVAFQVFDDALHLMTMSNKRMSTFKVGQAAIVDKFSVILINNKILEKIIKISDKGNNLEFHLADNGKMIVRQAGLDVRVVIPDEATHQGFYTLEHISKFPFEELTEIGKDTFNTLSCNVAILNKTSAIFNFDAEKNELTVKSVSTKHRPTTCKAELDTISKSQVSQWNPDHIKQGMKPVKSETLHLYVYRNGALRIQGETDPNYWCMVQAQNMNAGK